MKCPMNDLTILEPVVPSTYKILHTSISRRRTSSASVVYSTSLSPVISLYYRGHTQTRCRYCIATPLNRMLCTSYAGHDKLPTPCIFSCRCSTGVHFWTILKMISKLLQYLSVFHELLPLADCS